jgi:hypothetical protein
MAEGAATLFRVFDDVEHVGEQHGPCRPQDGVRAVEGIPAVNIEVHVPQCANVVSAAASIVHDGFAGAQFAVEQRLADGHRQRRTGDRGQPPVAAPTRVGHSPSSSAKRARSTVSDT